MNALDIREVVQEELNNIAPEVDLATIDPAGDLRETLDIDFMDFLNFITAIHHRLGIDIPELDYPKLVTLDGAVAYVAARTRIEHVRRPRACDGLCSQPRWHAPALSGSHSSFALRWRACDRRSGGQGGLVSCHRSATPRLSRLDAAAGRTAHVDARLPARRRDLRHHVLCGR